MKKIFLLLSVLFIAACSSAPRKAVFSSMEQEEINKITRNMIADVSEKELNKSLREIPYEKKSFSTRKISIPSEKDPSKEIQKNVKLAFVKGESEPFTGVFTTRYIGHLLYLEEYKDGLLNGNKIWFSDEGYIALKQPFVNNVKHGEQFTYFNNGNIRSVFPYKNGNLEGTIEWYDKDGYLFDSSTIKNGNGKYIIYWDNGVIRLVGTLKNNKRFGTWKQYNKYGELEQEIIYSSKGYISKQKWYK